MTTYDLSRYFTTIIAGDATNIIGGQVLGDSIKLTTSNLNIKSLQDTAVYDSQQKNISGQITVGAGWGSTSGGDVNLACVNITNNGDISCNKEDRLYFYLHRKSSLPPFPLYPFPYIFSQFVRFYYY
ncbi:MAG: hemagglutinin repeat-containing protein [Sulfurovaceae bacterium]